MVHITQVGINKTISLKFIGKFVEGKKHGKGEYIDVEGDEYEEEWNNNELEVRWLKTPSKLDEKIRENSRRSNLKKCTITNLLSRSSHSAE